MCPRPKRSLQQTDLYERIMAEAWKQISDLGAPALNLRAIARNLGITTPAIYHYYSDRDALVTALVINAFTSFGDSQVAARDVYPREKRHERLKAVGTAYRIWALAHPQRYLFIFGTPIPGYTAPLEKIMPSAARSLGALASVVEDFRTAGCLSAPGFPDITPGFEGYFEQWKKFGGEMDVHSLSVAVYIWARVHGLVSLEINGNLPAFGTNGDALYLYELDRLKDLFFKE